MSLRKWLAKGFDGDSQIVEGRPVETRVFVRPNRYAPGRAHVVVYNWENSDTVDVDLSEVLEAGAAYRIVDARNFFGPPVAEGRYDGELIALSMKPTKPVQPVGMPDYPLPETKPDFGIFVVLPV